MAEKVINPEHRRVLQFRFSALFALKDGKRFHDHNRRVRDFVLSMEDGCGECDFTDPLGINAPVASEHVLEDAELARTAGEAFVGCRTWYLRVGPKWDSHHE